MVPHGPAYSSRSGVSGLIGAGVLAAMFAVALAAATAAHGEALARAAGWLLR